MYYAIFGHDVADSLALRMQVREQHLRRIEALKNDGRLLAAGPHPAIDSPDPGAAGFSGSLIIAEFPSLEDARRWADEDPYSLAGVFSRVEIKPFKLVLP
jgi:uncharacterized protein YciI